MLYSISSFLTSTVHRGWSCLPAIKLPSAKKTALFAFAFFVIYKFYRAYQSRSLVNEIKKNEEFQSLKNRVETLEKENKGLQESLSEKIQKNKTLSETNKNLKEQLPAKKICFENNHFQSDIEDDACSLTDETVTYFDADETPDPNQIVTLNPSSLSIAPESVLPPLEQFKNTFPGAHITFTHQNSKTTLSDYLMQHLFRIEKVPSCVFDQSTNTFTLSCEAPKNVAVTQLPQAMWDEMPWGIPWIVSLILKVLPKAKISQTIKGQFVKTTQGIKIELNYPSISSVDKDYFLKSILIPDIATKNLLIEVSHRSNQFNITAPIGHELLAEFIDLNFSNQ